MNFWDTVRGNQLAETLIRYLPKLVTPKQQTTTVVAKKDVVDNVQSNIADGYKVVTTIGLDNDLVLIVYEK